MTSWGVKQEITIQRLSSISESKGSQAMKFGKLTELKMEKDFGR